MYSLYRAWFGDSVTPDNYSRLQETLSPPDTVVRVGNEGEHQFVAHKGVLAAHSGYLKALLTSAPTTPNQGVNTNITSCANLPTTAIAVTTTNLSGPSQRQPVTSVSVSSIGGEAFAPLLNYMYTGRLEVTLDNVYSVLLATHLLHMPGALEQCRAALLRLRAPPPLPTPIPVPAGPTSTLTSTSISTSTPGSGNILRPIPNRLMIDPSICWPPTAPLYPPTAPVPSSIGIPHLPQLQPSVLMQSTVPLGVSVAPTSSVQETHSSTAYREVLSPKSSVFKIERNRGLRVDCRPKSPENVSSNSLPFVAAAAAAFTTFTTSNVATSTRTSSPCQSISPTPSSASQSSVPPCQNKKTTEQQRQSTEEHRYEHPNSSNNEQQHRSPPLTPVEDTAIPRNGDKNIESTSISEDDRGRSRRRGRGSNRANDNSTGVLSVVYDVACCDGPVKFHRVLNENYSSTASCGSSSVLQPRLQRPCFEPENASGENDENGGPPAVRTPCDQIESAMDTGNSSGSYTCRYCRHTFKSQYCYRKHTKRHLLPTRANDPTGNRQRQDTEARNRREVRLLDLNVQYYPCKICGCKFPSYYFVHKHRKLCHANTEERTQSDEANSTATEDQESTTSTTNNDRQ
ncbi:mucin-2 isoform X1 [Bombus pascuorum]|uniref:mucin-2 isoform X1 n=2 Tax=Bombus pascuorum TaxID=65598 RepID=UPI00213696E2|nr:mucin-2 isoform X1 [Bombus pascuorum]